MTFGFDQAVRAVQPITAGAAAFKMVYTYLTSKRYSEDQKKELQELCDAYTEILDTNALSPILVLNDDGYPVQVPSKLLRRYKRAGSGLKTIAQACAGKCSFYLSQRRRRSRGRSGSNGDIEELIFFELFEFFHRELILVDDTDENTKLILEQRIEYLEYLSNSKFVDYGHLSDKDPKNTGKGTLLLLKEELIQAKAEVAKNIEKMTANKRLNALGNQLTEIQFQLENILFGFAFTTTRGFLNKNKLLGTLPSDGLVENVIEADLPSSKAKKLLLIISQLPDGMNILQVYKDALKLIEVEPKLSYGLSKWIGKESEEKLWSEYKAFAESLVSLYMLQSLLADAESLAGLRGTLWAYGESGKDTLIKILGDLHKKIDRLKLSLDAIEPIERTSFEAYQKENHLRGDSIDGQNHEKIREFIKDLTTALVAAKKSTSDAEAAIQCWPMNAEELAQQQEEEFFNNVKVYFKAQGQEYQIPKSPVKKRQPQVDVFDKRSDDEQERKVAADQSDDDSDGQPGLDDEEDKTPTRKAIRATTHPTPKAKNAMQLVIKPSYQAIPVFFLDNSNLPPIAKCHGSYLQMLQVTLPNENLSSDSVNRWINGYFYSNTHQITAFEADNKAFAENLQKGDALNQQAEGKLNSEAYNLFCNLMRSTSNITKILKQKEPGLFTFRSSSKSKRTVTRSIRLNYCANLIDAYSVLCDQAPEDALTKVAGEHIRSYLKSQQLMFGWFDGERAVFNRKIDRLLADLDDFGLRLKANKKGEQERVIIGNGTHEFLHQQLNVQAKTDDAQAEGQRNMADVELWKLTEINNVTYWKVPSTDNLAPGEAAHIASCFLEKVQKPDNKSLLLNFQKAFMVRKYDQLLFIIKQMFEELNLPSDTIITSNNIEQIIMSTPQLYESDKKLAELREVIKEYEVYKQDISGLSADSIEGYREVSDRIISPLRDLVRHAYSEPAPYLESRLNGMISSYREQALNGIDRNFEAEKCIYCMLYTFKSSNNEEISNKWRTLIAEYDLYKADAIFKQQDKVNPVKFVTQKLFA